MNLPDSNAAQLVHAPLGKTSTYEETYNPAQLFPIARQPKREELGLTGSTLPFYGEDVWHAFELSWLNPKGKPVVALAQFTFPASAPYLLESKSFKLYLNTFNQTSFSSTDAVLACLVQDLSHAAGADVRVQLTPLTPSCPVRHFANPISGRCLDDYDIEIHTYTPQATLLSANFDAPAVEETLYSHLLKSNCPVTGQPDWGMLAVRYRGAPISHEGLLRYIVSFRQHNEFHEQCVERVFCDILAQCRPEALTVWARYTRRGGLDINPWRAMPGLPPPELVQEIRQ